MMNAIDFFCGAGGMTYGEMKKITEIYHKVVGMSLQFGNVKLAI